MELTLEFVREAVDIFDRMLGVRLAERPASAANLPGEDFEVSAIVAITGPCPGRLVLSFTERGACDMVSKMLGQPHADVDAEVMDGVEEMANIVAGNGCRHLEEKGFREVATSVPHIMIGQRRRGGRSEDRASAVSRCFESDLGIIRVEVELNAACAA